MNIDGKILRIGAAVILCAVFVRLLGNNPSIAIDHEGIGTALVFLQTGRVVKLSKNVETQPTEESPAPAATEPEPAGFPVTFSSEDAALIQINDYAGKDPDPESLLLQQLNWELTGDEPTVLILHTHATESYLKTEEYKESSQYRTLDEGYNMLSIGDRVAALLEDRGITVLHDRTLHDYPSYNGSYSASRETIREYLKEYPSIQLVLDLHRDAMTDSGGNQIGYTVSTDWGKAAKVMLVIGCNNSSWKENAALGAKLQVQLEKLCPGICRPMALRKSRFNQDLSPGAVLIEMGSAGNTRQEALLAAEYVAQAIIDLSYGTQ